LLGAIDGFVHIDEALSNEVNCFVKDILLQGSVSGRSKFNLEHFQCHIDHLLLTFERLVPPNYIIKFVVRHTLAQARRDLTEKLLHF
jgi:hypothetical protein